MPSKKQKFDWLAISGIATPAITGGMLLLGGYVLKGVIEKENLADRPYVDHRIGEVKQYTDDKVGIALEHSDTNRREMTLKMEQISGEMNLKIERLNSDYKSTTNVLSTKIDNILEIVRGLENTRRDRR